MKEYCKSIGAMYYRTSAYLNSGIDQLFREIGLKYLERFLGGNNGRTKHHAYGTKNSLNLNKSNHNKRKKCC